MLYLHQSHNLSREKDFHLLRLGPVLKLEDAISSREGVGEGGEELGARLWTTSRDERTISIFSVPLGELLSNATTLSFFTHSYVAYSLANLSQKKMLISRLFNVHRIGWAPSHRYIMRKHFCDTSPITVRSFSLVVIIQSFCTLQEIEEVKERYLASCARCSWLTWLKSCIVRLLIVKLFRHVIEHLAFCIARIVGPQQISFKIISQCSIQFYAHWILLLSQFHVYFNLLLILCLLIVLFSDRTKHY